MPYEGSIGFKTRYPDPFAVFHSSVYVLMSVVCQTHPSKYVGDTGEDGAEGRDEADSDGLVDGGVDEAAGRAGDDKGHS